MIILILCLYAALTVAAVLAVAGAICLIFWRGLALPVGFGVFWTATCLLALPAVRLVYDALNGFGTRSSASEETRALEQLGSGIAHGVLAGAWLIGLGVALTLLAARARPSQPFAWSGRFGVALAIYALALAALWLIPGQLRAGRATREAELARAVQAGDLDALRRLGAAGADLSAPVAALGGRSPLHYAIEQGRADVVALALELPARAGKPPLDSLTYAAERGTPAVVAAFLGHGADVNQFDGAPLRAAAEAGRLEVASLLLERGASVDARAAFQGQSALMGAANRQPPDVAMAALLLERGADPNLLSNGTGGMAPTGALHIAAGRGNAALVPLLAQHGADVNLKDGNGDTALAIAERGGYADVAAALRAAGAR